MLKESSEWYSSAMGQQGWERRGSENNPKLLFCGNSFLMVQLQLRARWLHGRGRGWVAGSTAVLPENQLEREPLCRAPEDEQRVFGGRWASLTSISFDEGVIGGWWVSEFYICLSIWQQKEEPISSFPTMIIFTLTPGHRSLVFSSKIILLDSFLFPCPTQPLGLASPPS